MGTSGDDIYKGSDGADVLGGLSGRDTLTGNGGDDLLSGGGDNDVLDGGTGNDSLVGGGGNDLLYGGAGVDRYVFQAGDGFERIEDNGDTAIDTLRIEGYGVGLIRFSRTGADGVDLTIRFTGSADRIVVANAFAADAGDRIEQFEITASALTLSHDDVLTRVTADVPTTGETLLGDGEANGLTGGAGDDYLTGGAGSDTLNGGAGNDLFADIVADASIDLLQGGPGRDTYRYLPTYAIPAGIAPT